MPFEKDAHFRALQAGFRCAAVAALCLAWACRSSLNSAVASLWEACLRSPWFLWDSFEPCTVAVAFTLSMGYFYVKDRYIPAAASRRPVPA